MLSFINTLEFVKINTKRTVGKAIGINLIEMEISNFNSTFSQELMKIEQIGRIEKFCEKLSMGKV